MLENTTKLLGVFGVLLFSFFLFPIFWFLILSVYSVLVVIRCLFTLLRKTFAKFLETQGTYVPRYYSAALDQTYHGGYIVKFVLSGWLVTNCVLAVSSFTAFGLLYFYFFSLTKLPYSGHFIVFLMLLAAILLVYFKHGEKNYQWVEESASLHRSFHRFEAFIFNLKSKI
jgi:hypothetical protein